MMAKYDIKQAMASIWIPAGAVLMAVILTFMRLDELADIFVSGKPSAYGSMLDFLITSLKGDTAVFLIPVLCTFPYASCMVDEIKSHMVRQAVLRTTKKKYLISKAGSCALAGGTVLLAGVLLTALVQAILLLPFELKPQDGQNVYIQLKSVLWLCLIYFFSGAFWAVVGLLISTMTNNKYMAYISPFMVSYLLIIFHERYFSKLLIIYPKEWLLLEKEWVFGAGGIVLWLIELTAAVSCLFVLAGGRCLERI